MTTLEHPGVLWSFLSSVHFILSSGAITSLPEYSGGALQGTLQQLFELWSIPFAIVQLGRLRIRRVHFHGALQSTKNVLGIRQPLMVSNPHRPEEHGTVSDTLAGLLDIVPTIMDWHQAPLPSYTVLKKGISFTGRTLLDSDGCTASSSSSMESKLPSHF